MLRRAKSIILVVLVLMLSIVISPSVSAFNYDIGRVSSGGGNVDWYLYDSGVSLKISNDKYLDYLHLILDGNESTGLDHNFGADSSAFNVILYFPFSIFVHNITIKPVYNGSASSCTLFISEEHFGVALASSVTTESFYTVNVKINSMQITIDNGGTNHFYFNDIIINYIPAPTDLEGVIETINILTNQIDNLNNEYNNIKNDIVNINNYLNESDSQILENITKLWNSFNMLNQSINYLTEQLQQLNISVYRNITSIEKDIAIIKLAINDLDEAIKSLMKIDYDDDLSDLQDQINSTVIDINNLYDNITSIRKSVLEGFDEEDGTLLDKIFQLESENAILRQEIDNLTKRMDTIKDTETERVIEKSEGDDNILYAALGLGLIAILIAIISVFIRRARPGEIEAESTDEGLPEPQVQTVMQTPQAPLAQPAYPVPEAPPAAEIPSVPEAAVVQAAHAEEVKEVGME